MKEFKRIYVAGSYNADNVIKVLDNIKRGTQVSVELLKKGYIPFCPWLDFHFFWFAEISFEEVRRYSMGWLEVSDCIYVLKNSEKSKGTQDEIKRARELGIPVLYEGLDTIEDLIEWTEDVARLEAELDILGKWEYGKEDNTM